MSFNIGFHRGICQVFECTWDCWREHGDIIWERELPWRVRLTTWPGVAHDGHFRGTANLRSVWRWTLIDFPFSVPFEGGESRDIAIRRLLASRWPGIDFELPPVGEERAFDEAGYVRARLREHAIDQIAVLHNIHVREWERLGREFRLNDFTQRAYRVPCECNRYRRAIDEVMRTVELRPQDFALDTHFDRRRTWRMRTYHGRCGGCGLVHYAIGEPELVDGRRRPLPTG